MQASATWDGAPLAQEEREYIRSREKEMCGGPRMFRVAVCVAGPDVSRYRRSDRRSTILSTKEVASSNPRCHMATRFAMSVSNVS